jgi:hypothetical protein
MTMRILTGRLFNLLERGILTMPTAHAQLPKERLFDGRPSRAYRSAAVGAAQFFRVDGNLISDGISDFGGFEAWTGGTPNGWTEVNSGTGDVTQETTIKNSGASSAKLSAGTGFASLSRDVVVKAGEVINIESALRGDGTTETFLRIYNPLTHKYLQVNGTWGFTNVGYRVRTAASFEVLLAAVTVEDYAACQSDTVALKVEVRNQTTSGIGYADDVRIWPRVNFLGCFGHNIDVGGGNGSGFLSSIDNFGSNTNEGALVIIAPSFYKLLAAGNQDRRYWAMYINDANSVPIELGELVIGYAQQPLQQHEDPVESDSRWDRQASVTPGGERHVHKRSKWQVRSRVFHYNLWSQAAYDNARELFHLRPEGDTYPVVIVPETTRSEVIHGRLRANLGDSLIVTDYYTDVAVELEESPFASTAF